MKSIFAIILLFSGVAMAIEEPIYKVLAKDQNYEIRQYGPTLVAETYVEANFEDAGNQAFRILAAYIFGENLSKTKIAMTAPVNQVAGSSEKIEMTAPVTQSKRATGALVQFTMPAQYTLETLPVPKDSRVSIRQIPPRTVAVFSYSGSWSESRYQSKLKEFRQDLLKNDLRTIGEPVFARFNSPFQVWFLRRNEIWLELVEGQRFAR